MCSLHVGNHRRVAAAKATLSSATDRQLQCMILFGPFFVLVLREAVLVHDGTRWAIGWIPVCTGAVSFGTPPKWYPAIVYEGTGIQSTLSNWRRSSVEERVHENGWGNGPFRYNRGALPRLDGGERREQFSVKSQLGPMPFSAWRCFFTR